MRAKIETLKANSDCLYDLNMVQLALQGMAWDLEQQLADQEPVFLAVVNGAMMPLGQLLPYLNFPLQLDYIHASRYHGAVTGENQLTWHAKPQIDLKDRVVVLFDDILDQGLTLAGLKHYCYQAGAKQVYTVVMADKQCSRHSAGEQQADFCAFTVPDRFVYGCGLDYKGYLRNEAGIFAVRDVTQLPF